MYTSYQCYEFVHKIQNYAIKTSAPVKLKGLCKLGIGKNSRVQMICGVKSNYMWKQRCSAKGDCAIMSLIITGVYTRSSDNKYMIIVGRQCGDFVNDILIVLRTEILMYSRFYIVIKGRDLCSLYDKTMIKVQTMLRFYQYTI